MPPARRTSAWLPLAMYLLAAFAPCGVSPLDAAVAAADGAAPRIVAPPAGPGPCSVERPPPFMTQKCPCSCTERPHAVGVTTAPGYPLMAAHAGLVCPPLLVSRASTSLAASPSFVPGIEPVPI